MYFIAEHQSNDEYVHKMLGDKYERDLLVLTAALADIFEDCDEDEVKDLFKLLGRNQQGIGTCAISSFLKVYIHNKMFCNKLHSIRPERCTKGAVCIT